MLENLWAELSVLNFNNDMLFNNCDEELYNTLSVIIIDQIIEVAVNSL